MQILLCLLYEKVYRHTEEWGTFLDVKHWDKIKDRRRYAGQTMIVGSVTDGYNPQEEIFCAREPFLNKCRAAELTL